MIDLARAIESHDILKGFECFVDSALLEQSHTYRLLSFRFFHFLIDLHVKAIFALSEVIDSNNQKDSLRNDFHLQIFFVILVIRAKGEHGVVPALNLSYLRWLHSFYRLLEHLGNAVVIEIALAAVQFLQGCEVLPPIALEERIHEDGFLLAVDELERIVDNGRGICLCC